MKDLNFGSVDVFAIPTSLLATRGNQYSGSLAGCFFTFIFMIIVLFFTSYKILRMTDDDKYIRSVLPNDFKEFNVNLADNFLPSI